jgi:hypothetical protein
MGDAQIVTVYNFRTFDQGVEASEPTRYKATRERIAELREALILEGTAEQVPRSALDDQGFYRRIATGWGEL